MNTARYWRESGHYDVGIFLIRRTEYNYRPEQFWQIWFGQQHIEDFNTLEEAIRFAEELQMIWNAESEAEKNK